MRASRVLGARVKVLFVSANPVDTSRLAVGAELRAVQDHVLRSAHRDRIEFEYVPEGRTLDLGESLQRAEPDVLHFSGHGTADGEILLSDEAGRARPASPEALGALFASLSDSVPLRVVVLNACYTEPLAKALSKHVDCVIGVPDALRDKVAITFAGAFYFSLGNGLDVRAAYDFACAQVMLAQSPDAVRPTLHPREGVDPRRVVIVTSRDALPEPPPVAPPPTALRVAAIVTSLVAVVVTAIAWRVSQSPVEAPPAQTPHTPTDAAIVDASLSDATPPGAATLADATARATPREVVRPHRERDLADHRAPLDTVPAPVHVAPPDAVSAPAHVAPPAATPTTPCAWDDPSCQRVER